MDEIVQEALSKGVEMHKAGELDLAKQLYTSILQLQPQHPDANHNLGVIAIDAGNIKEAVPFLQTALEADPNQGQYWISYIETLIKLDALDDAQSMLNQAKEKGASGDAFDQLEQTLNELTATVADNGPVNSPDEKPTTVAKDVSPPQDQLQVLIDLYSQGQLQQALVEAGKLLQKFPNSVTLYNIQGAANAGLKQLDEAIESYKKAIEIKPDFAEAYNNMGAVQQDQGDLKAALESYRQALKIKPDYANAYYNLGVVQKDQGDLEAAIDSYKRALKIKPDYANAYYNLGNVLKDKGDLEAATDNYKKALQINPDHAETYNNLGICQQEKGDLEAAIDSCKQAIKISPEYIEAHNNMGGILHDKGELEAAIESYKRAIKIEPNYAEAYYNMGNALRETGDLEAAIESYKKAIKIKPDYAEAYSNMGTVVHDKGELEAAIESYTQAIKIKPDHAEAYFNMGNTLLEKGELEAAIESYKQAIKIKPNYAHAYNNMGNALEKVVFTKPNSGMLEIIFSILDRKSCVRAEDISGAAVSLLKFEPHLLKAFEQHSKGQLIQSLEETVSNLCELPLLLKLITVCPLHDLKLEALLTKIRSGLLLSSSEIVLSTEGLRFQSALALQCFTNEYIYNYTDKETKALAALEALVKETLLKGDQPSAASILCLATYKALNEYEWCDLLAVTADIEEIFTRQVLEPKQEARLKHDIPVLQEITDKVSSKVREQYEENPYPRWVNLGLRLAPATVPEIVQEVKLKLFDHKINDVEAPNILVAGCGTGQHSIGTATRFKNSNVLAIDLSLSSLTYAKRKTAELGVQNIEYMQADILDIGKLDRQFDIIECAGTLVCMDNPMAGWRVLTDCLKQGGLMHIALYSELGRQHIAEMRKEISQLGNGSNDIAMKAFRNSVINSDQEHHKRILNSGDFYSLSTLRDLLFHVQEHRFTIPQIKECLSTLGLKFCGFQTDNIIHNFKLANTGADDRYDLNKWNAYEEANPHTFGSMYQFWCQKIT
jgi:tetratricopeptide (TPR) repeat protein/2-polyprenyl-3-methyl-5-hydroxy-6-metoxy-1,4-benzoquinol methylase